VIIFGNEIGYLKTGDVHLPAIGLSINYYQW